MPFARRRQSVRRRWQRVCHRSFGQPDAHTSGDRTAGSRSHSRDAKAMSAPARSLDDKEMMVLRGVMDRLVPPIDDLPGAGAMGLAQEVNSLARRHEPY